MKRLVLFLGYLTWGLATAMLLLLFLYVTCMGQGLTLRSPLRDITAVAASVPLLINEDFEGVGTPSGWGVVGTPSFDNVASPLSGVQDLIQNATANSDANYVFTDAAEIWIAFELSYNTLPTASSLIIALYDSPGFTKAGAIIFDVNGKLSASDGTATSTTTDIMATGTKYYIWLHVLKGTGANAVIEVEFSTTNTRTGAGNKYAVVTTGNVDVNLNYFLIRRIQTDWTNTRTFHIDNVRLSIVGWPS